ncbi:MAG: hypothetical protein WCX84_02950 [Syntrophales bacterium]|jgi:hypothetical protein|nr:hypothetical protein [Syntrophales bacterium]
MNNGETGCLVFGAKEACIIMGLEGLNTKAVQLAVKIKKVFEELGV